ncbi:ATP-binding cassette domain-containing protein [Enterococcus faecalis]|uniref:ATP-binding cassette domain-containing protein n=1 Tax=Enterococcus faecalis TaxID=1351 RepID=A0A974S6P5_ENTFL|nr:ATP-binding cassette domain-containing protein [Enterococcus faecalis]
MLGRSGSGKSTLASLIRGDLRPTSGEILFRKYPN